MVTSEGSHSTTLPSILCGNVWWWDSDRESHIIFHENGTGLIVARRELCLFIVSELQWKFTRLKDSPNISQVIDINKSMTLANFEVEICQTKNHPSKFGNVDLSEYEINESLLTEDVFLPQNYILTLEKGEFMADGDAVEDKRCGAPIYQYQLRFDRSPYPAREQWKDPTGAPDAMRFWEWKEFCGGEQSKSNANDKSQDESRRKPALRFLWDVFRKLWRRHRRHL